LGSETEQKSNDHAKMFGCTKCGSPFPAYPPDDVHCVASRNSSSFLETIEASYVCASCNEATTLYWGKPVLLRPLIVAFNRLIQALMQIVSRRARVEKEEEAPSDIPQADVGMPESLDDEIYNYIMSNGGAIAVNKASEELGVAPELVKEALERLSAEGRLRPHMAAAEAAA
jgi:hypothetical protein